ncbi:MAG TPA: hypothetical protein VGP70_15945 [Actinomadura sp.]|nr:hypothetical protein [Actinomadura sp.]
MTVWGIGGPSYWRDESVSVVAAHMRTLVEGDRIIMGLRAALFRP